MKEPENNFHNLFHIGSSHGSSVNRCLLLFLGLWAVFLEHFFKNIDKEAARERVGGAQAVEILHQEENICCSVSYGKQFWSQWVLTV